MALNETSSVEQGNSQKLTHKQWKKLKRKQKRQALAQQKHESACDSSKGTDTEEEERRRQAVEEENMRQHMEWERRDRLAHQQWQERREQEERERQRREEMERKIREEWEERERREQEEKEKKEKEEAEKKEKQVIRVSWVAMETRGKDTLLKQATRNEHKEWHNPLAPVNYNSSSNLEIVREVNKCPFFTKTGACRFGDRCSRAHMRPDSSTILLIAGMFQSFELKKSSVDDYDTDINLEYEDSELYNAFREFYHDVVPEFKSVGRVVNVKVCCNHEPHLRGNVYIQYKREREAHDAFVKFNARWYAGHQLTCEFVSIAKWKSAICGLFFAKRCPKGKTCNFLHVFRNPGNEFWEADRDFETSARHDRRDITPVWRPRSEHHSRRHRSTRSRSRSRSRTRESSRSYSSHNRSTRDRSRSPVSRSRSRRKSPERSPPESGKRRNTVPQHSLRRDRTRSSSRESSYNGSRDSKRKRSRLSRSRSPSRNRSKERDSTSNRKRSRSRSSSSEGKGTEKKHKKHKHKKSKKSSKKKKDKHAGSVSRRLVSVPHPDDSEEDVHQVGNGDHKEEGAAGHSDGWETDAEKGEVVNGVGCEQEANL